MIKDLSEKILEMIPGTGSGIEYKPLPKDDPVRRKPDISRARNALQWQPKVPLDAGLEATIAYFRSELGTGDGRN
jgi:UDP-glucuronate decarboxylase